MCITEAKIYVYFSENKGITDYECQKCLYKIILTKTMVQMDTILFIKSL